MHPFLFIINHDTLFVNMPANLFSKLFITTIITNIIKDDKIIVFKMTENQFLAY